MARQLMQNHLAKISQNHRVEPLRAVAGLKVIKPKKALRLIAIAAPNPAKKPTKSSNHLKRRFLQANLKRKPVAKKPRISNEVKG